MAFEISEKGQSYYKRVLDFVEKNVIPNEDLFSQQVDEGDRWQPVPILEELKGKAKEAGLWNMFLPESELGAGLTNLEYAPIAELMGRHPITAEAMNCSAPDTGNMEVLVRYGNDEVKEKWLKPLLAGEIRSAFCMTEPAVASSDATNIESRIERDGDEYVINGRKWWSSGAGDPRCNSRTKSRAASCSLSTISSMPKTGAIRSLRSTAARISSALVRSRTRASIAASTGA